MAAKTGTNTRRECVYAFLDTNILIHFDFINKIPWPTVLKSKRVCLIFSPIIFRELDDIKDGMRHPGRRDLARRVLKLIGGTLEDVALDTPVDLPESANTQIMYASEDNLEIHSGLRQEKQDDHLIAAVLHYIQAHPEAEVVLVSDDFNCRQRAKQFGISRLTLPDSYRRDLPPTEVEKELKRLKAKEPQVEVKLGVADDVLELPYTKRKTHLGELQEAYAQKIKDVVEALKSYHEWAQPPRSAASTARGSLPPRLKSLKDEDPNVHLEPNQTLITALKQLDIDVYPEWLHPQPKVRRWDNNEPTPDCREDFEQWQDHVRELYELARERGKQLYYARQDLSYYDLPVVVRHVGGDGIQDGHLTMTLEGTFEFRTSKPQGKDTWGRAYHPVSTRWTDKLTPFQADNFVKTFNFDKLHPKKVVESDPLHIYIKLLDDALNDDKEQKLTVEVSGLNVKEPFQKTYKVRVV